mmetsp:Transcript_23791/g.58333  ORF Transcript_23791/g.58333 Transcript_23791/m.58333 type:complete len:452 (+) Transcript_23791:184-1539(+)
MLGGIAMMRMNNNNQGAGRGRRPFGGCAPGCCQTIAAVVLFFIALGFFSACATFSSEAAADPRAGKVKSYNVVVSKWTGGSEAAYATKWIGSDAKTLPRISALTSARGVVNATAFTVLTTGDAAVGKLSDTETDYTRYEKGVMLSAQLPNFHQPGMETDEEFQISLGDQSITVPGFVCELDVLKRRKRKYYYARRKFVTGVQLVDKVNDPGTFTGVKGLYDESCALTYSEAKPIGEYLENIGRARQDCAFRRPSSAMSVSVTLRSPEDPYVNAGRIAGCNRDFGFTVDELTTLGLTTGIVGIFPSLACFAFFYAASRVRAQHALFIAGGGAVQMQMQPQHQTHMHMHMQHPGGGGQQYSAGGQQYPQQGGVPMGPTYGNPFPAQPPQFGQPVYGQPASSYGQFGQPVMGQPVTGQQQQAPNPYGLPQPRAQVQYQQAQQPPPYAPYMPPAR